MRDFLGHDKILVVEESSLSQASKSDEKPTQPCPVCNLPIGALAGSKEAICLNCGYKDPCCE
jgi:hypothetical protein